MMKKCPRVVAPEQPAPTGAPAGGAACNQEGAAPHVRALLGEAGVLPPPEARLLCRLGLSGQG